jgi:thiol-disulfide isomerase/thioredoxin
MLMMGRAGRSLLLFLLAAVAGVAAYFASRAWLAPEPPQVPAASARAPAVIPERRPEVTLADRDGKPRSLSEWNGKPQVINFWATWCAPCRREIPMLNSLAADPDLAAFALIGIAIDFREDVLAFLKATPIRYPVLIGEQDGLEAVQKFGQGSLGFPFTVFTDQRQRIVLFHLGEIDQAKADVLLGVVAKVNRGELTPEQARIVAAKQLEALPPAEG